MDDVEISQVEDYEKELIEFLSSNKSKTVETIINTGKIDDDTESELKSAIEDFNATYSSN